MLKQTKKLIITTLSALLLILSIAGCVNEDEKPVNLSEKELYEAVQKNLRDESFNLAVKNLQLLEARYPFGPYAEQAQLEIIYAHYRDFDPAAAIAAANRFIRLHPLHSNVDYAYYMRGLADYASTQGFLDRFVPTDITQRDPGAALQSFEHFRQLLFRFPDSAYATDAKARMVFLRARLARHEINVANYYFKRGAYTAAANRGRYVVENFSNTPATADALAVMTQAYLLLGLNDLANDSLAVLNKNFPDHPSLDENGEFKDKFSVTDTKKSLINKVTLGLFDHAEPPKFDSRAEYLTR